MNLACVAYIHHDIIPIALSLLPQDMGSTPARAMLIAIGLQESRFDHRRQLGDGPARGYWQFEKTGVRGVLTHPSTQKTIEPILEIMNYPPDVAVVHAAIEHNDVLAAVMARLLLWTLPGSLPTASNPVLGWSQYLKAWRPGKPHPETWEDFFKTAWQFVQD